jgi:hypothetical protein
VEQVYERLEHALAAQVIFGSGLDCTAGET